MSNLDFSKLNGLIPAIIQDNESKQVLMLGFMNEESYKKTIEDKKVWFYSRTKKRLWMKGEQSQNYLNVIEIKKDCDLDTLLILVKPEGNTCHTGEYSCFGEKEIGISFLNTLYNIIKERKNNPKEGSYTSGLFKSGENKIIQKVGEEATEVVIAAKNNNKSEIIYESADLIYHLIILLTEKGISLEEIICELERRNKK